MATLGIVLIVIGGILSFAVQDNIAEVDLTMVGYICMGVGALAVVVGLIQSSIRRRSEHVTRVDRSVHTDHIDQDRRPLT